MMKKRFSIRSQTWTLSILLLLAACQGAASSTQAGDGAVTLTASPTSSPTEETSEGASATPAGERQAAQQSPEPPKPTNTLSPTLTQPWPGTPPVTSAAESPTVTQTPPGEASPTAASPTDTPVPGLFWFKPANVSVPAGAAAQVMVQLDGVAGVYGAQFQVSFDPAILAVVDADGGQDGVQIEAGSCPAPGLTVINVADNQNGLIDYAVTQISPQPACDGGDAAVITFQCVASGTTALTFMDWIVSDENGAALSVSVQAGTVKCQE